MRLIDADALIQKRNHAKVYSKDMYVIGQGYVLDAPTIYALPFVLGKWIQCYDHQFTGDDWDTIPYIYCSECKHLEWHFDIVNTYFYPLNFCPNCGAKMAEGVF